MGQTFVISFPLPSCPAAGMFHLRAPEKYRDEKFCMKHDSIHHKTIRRQYGIQPPGGRIPVDRFAV